MFHHLYTGRVSPVLQQINENGTRYYLTPKGSKYPSVTTVLSQHNIEGIMKWRKRVGEEAANKISSKAAGRGTTLHKQCEHYLNNSPTTFKTPFEKDLFNRVKPYLDRIDNIHAQELRMFSDHLRMAGTVDCIAEFDGELAIIDFKTSSKPKKTEYIDNYFMQCAAYAIMYEERYGIPINRIIIIVAVEDDDSQIFYEKRDNHVKQLLHYRNQYEIKMN